MEREDPTGIAVVEAALLIEAGVARDFERVIVVVCNPEWKAARYARRTGLGLEEARAEVERRSAAQLSDAEKAGHAHYVIDNSGAVERTEQVVEKVWKELQGLAKG